MKLYSDLQNSWAHWPRPVRLFFIKAALLVLVWKLVYLLWLLPAGQPNRWLTNSTATATAALLNTLGERPKTFAHYEATRAHVYNERKQNLLIGNSCNALEIHVLYAGFLLCFLPTRQPMRWALFFAGGLLLLYGLNVLRCAGLYWLMVHQPHWLDIAHKFIFKFLLYSAVASLWYAFTRRLA